MSNIGLSQLKTSDRAFERRYFNGQFVRGVEFMVDQVVGRNVAGLQSIVA